MNFLQREYVRREEMLVEYDALLNEVDVLRERIAKVNAKLEQYGSKDNIKAEMEEIKGYMIQLGYIQHEGGDLV